MWRMAIRLDNAGVNSDVLIGILGPCEASKIIANIFYFDVIGHECACRNPWRFIVFMFISVVTGQYYLSLVRFRKKKKVT
jgi:hypothetical protein